MRIGFYISGKSTRLSKYFRTGYYSGSGICFVFSDEPIENKLREELEEYGIEYYDIDYGKLEGDVEKKRSAFSDCLLCELEKRKIDYCISFGKHILVGDILQKYKNKIINFHPALLPMFRGNRAIDQAVEDGSAMLVGNTAHFVDEGVDTGMIIMQSVVPIKAFFDSGRDYDVVLDLQIEMLEKIILLLNSDRIRIVNDKVEIIGADYSKAHIYPEI